MDSPPRNAGAVPIPSPHHSSMATKIHRAVVIMEQDFVPSRAFWMCPQRIQMHGMRIVSNVIFGHLSKIHQQRDGLCLFSFVSTIGWTMIQRHADRPKTVDGSSSARPIHSMLPL